MVCSIQNSLRSNIAERALTQLPCSFSLYNMTILRTIARSCSRYQGTSTLGYQIRLLSELCSRRLSTSATPLKISPEERDFILAGDSGLSGWTLEDGGAAIVKNFEFENFIASWGFMSSVAVYAEKMDHHPEWFNVYNRVKSG